MIDYQEELEQYQERIDELAKEKRYAELRDLFLPMEPADIALLLEEGKQEQMPLLYRLLPKGHGNPPPAMQKAGWSLKNQTAHPARQ